MKIGIIVDGVAEYQSVGLLLPRIAQPNDIGPIVKADLQPGAPVGQIVRVVNSTIRNALTPKGVDRVLVVVNAGRKLTRLACESPV